MPSGPLGEEDVEELRSERSIRGLKVSTSLLVANRRFLGLALPDLKLTAFTLPIVGGGT